MTQEILAELAALEEAYQQAPERDYEDLPDGDYTAYVYDGTVEKSKGSGRLQWKLTLRITGPKYRGRYAWYYRGLKEQEDLSRLKGDLNRLKLKLESITDLPELTKTKVRGMHISFRLKTGSDGFQRMYLGGPAPVPKGGEELEPSPF
ncbi:DUF669 domain-containing protein [Caldinitratiruptor microaerophilus]|uniref:DUF669 domain-containing protein n=1 Tax=Caldinitratiruptor microaerophilus TaxID=671077 RepID=A0AA35CMG2_9FIRM|nr:DUF669 domain-containing protein [Caldinitratiruptor microaerophilus]BDG60267.1 hypothetical protein caldi_13570 [Caldinitratiruptor microaerophilus]